MIRISETNKELVAWDCERSYGKPVCVSTDGPEGGYSVNLYVRGGVIVGVDVFERVMKDPEHVSVGLVPENKE